MNATELRKRLELYFAEDGAREPVVVEMPRGSYSLDFHPRAAAPAPVTAPAIAASGVEPVTSKQPVPTPAAVTKKRFRFATLWPAVCVLLLLACGVLLWQNLRLRRDANPWRNGAALRSFWAGFLDNGQQVDIVLADTSFALTEDIEGRSIPLASYLNYDYKHLDSVPGTSSDRWEDLQNGLDRNNGSVGDYIVAQRILALDHKDLEVRDISFGNSPNWAQGDVGALDRERGVAEGISPVPWQTDTCIGDWHYRNGATYKSSKKVVDLLVDIVSKNGNLLLNFPLPNSGKLDPDEMTTLEGITAWMAVNSEGIYATKPWKTYGEGPSTKVSVGNGGFNEGKKPDMGADDIRYTTKGPAMYAFVMGWPTPAAGAPAAEVVLPALGTASAQSPAKVHAVSLLGGPTKLKFTQEAAGLRVTLPQQKPAASDIGITLKVMTA